MKKFFFIIILIINFETLKAESINDFQIAGISIGDSALDFFSEDDLKSKRFMYKNKKYASVAKLIDNGPYEGVSVEFEANDKKLIIKAINGKILYDNKNFNDCYKSENQIVRELKIIFKDNALYNNFGITVHPGDKTGKSSGSHHQFDMKDGSGFVMVECMNWADETGFTDNLKVSIITDEFNKFLIETYK